MKNSNRKKFVFVSDFDGTLTDKDFYQIIIDEYFKEEGMKLYKAWKNNEYKDIDFLGTIYKAINRNEQEILEDIFNIPLDVYAKEFIAKVKYSGGDFVVLSAGTSYYINKLLENKEIAGVEVISNEGYYENKGICLKVDTESPHYSEVYGVDKEKVVKSFKDTYEKVYFAGDSAPDLKAAMLADITFAKGKLQDLLRNVDCSFIPIENFKQIQEYLINEGILVNNN